MTAILKTEPAGEHKDAFDKPVARLCDRNSITLRPQQLHNNGLSVTDFEPLQR